MLRARRRKQCLMAVLDSKRLFGAVAALRIFLYAVDAGKIIIKHEGIRVFFLKCT